MNISCIYIFNSFTLYLYTHVYAEGFPNSNNKLSRRSFCLFRPSVQPRSPEKLFHSCIHHAQFYRRRTTTVKCQQRESSPVFHPVRSGVRSKTVVFFGERTELSIFNSASCYSKSLRNFAWQHRRPMFQNVIDFIACIKSGLFNITHDVYVRISFWACFV